MERVIKRDLCKIITNGEVYRVVDYLYIPVATKIVPNPFGAIKTAIDFTSKNNAVDWINKNTWFDC